MKASDLTLDQVMKSKERFYLIFDNMTPNEKELTGNMVTYDEYDEYIETNFDEWRYSRVKGMSASMAFYAANIEAVKLIDSILKNAQDCKKLKL